MTDYAEFRKQLYNYWRNMPDYTEFREQLYNYCYDRVAQKPKWRNRDFDLTFDAEVHEMYRVALDILR